MKENQEILIQVKTCRQFDLLLLEEEGEAMDHLIKASGKSAEDDNWIRLALVLLVIRFLA